MGTPNKVAYQKTLQTVGSKLSQTSGLHAAYEALVTSSGFTTNKLPDINSVFTDKQNYSTSSSTKLVKTVGEVTAIVAGASSVFQIASALASKTAVGTENSAATGNALTVATQNSVNLATGAG